MDYLVNALKTMVEAGNWYGAVVVSLTVPDICGYLEDPSVGSQSRYEQWFENYLLEKYTATVGAEDMVHVFLSPADCYALRCAVLHEGREEIGEQRARDALERFHFVEPPASGTIHCNSLHGMLQLQVDIFVNDVIEALEAWLDDVSGNEDIEARMGSLMRIHPPDQIPGLFTPR